jgi:Flp pilus assembly pilin Flp
MPSEERATVNALLARFVADDQGQDLIEYGLLIGIITVACITAILAIGPKVGSYFTQLNANLP